MFLLKKKKVVYIKGDFQYKMTNYAPYDLLRSKKFRAYLDNRIDRGYVRKLASFLKEGDYGSYKSILSRGFRLYFSYVVLKCIQGYLVPFLNDSTLFFKVYGYIEDENEKEQRKAVNSLISNAYGIDNSIDTKDFWLRSYRIGLFKLDKDASLYNYTGYFLRLNSKYKKLLEIEIKNNREYDNIQFRFE